MRCSASSMPRPEQVELHQPDGGAVVLVPLQHAAPGHASPLHGADLDDRAVAQHHAGRVDAQMARDGRAPRPPARPPGAGSLPRLAAAPVTASVGAPPGRAVDPGRPPVHLLGAEPEGLAHVAHGRAGPVGDDVGHLRRVAAAVALVDVLDDLLAPARLDVDVDVGRPVPGRGQEALEEEAEVDGVDVGDPEGVTDGRVGRRAPALAVDVQRAGRPGRCPRRPGSSRRTPAGR